jgi:hypothetical protein
MVTDFNGREDTIFFLRKEFEKCIYFVIYLYVFKLFEELSVSIVDLTVANILCTGSASRRQ